MTMEAHTRRVGSNRIDDNDGGSDNLSVLTKSGQDQPALVPLGDKVASEGQNGECSIEEMTTASLMNIVGNSMEESVKALAEVEGAMLPTSSSFSVDIDSLLPSSSPIFHSTQNLRGGQPSVFKPTAVTATTGVVDSSPVLSSTGESTPNLSTVAEAIHRDKTTQLPPFEASLTADRDGDAQLHKVPSITKLTEVAETILGGNTSSGTTTVAKNSGGKLETIQPTVTHRIANDPSSFVFASSAPRPAVKRKGSSKKVAGKKKSAINNITNQKPTFFSSATVDLMSSTVSSPASTAVAPAQSIYKNDSLFTTCPYQPADVASTASAVVSATAAAAAALATASSATLAAVASSPDLISTSSTIAASGIAPMSSTFPSPAISATGTSVIAGVTATTTTSQNKKAQIQYNPDVPMTKEQLTAWRREMRRVRNRESAAASRRKIRDRIEELEEEVEMWKRKHEEVMEKLRILEEKRKFTGNNGEGQNKRPKTDIENNTSSTDVMNS